MCGPYKWYKVGACVRTTEYCRKVVSRRKVGGAFRSLGNARNLQLKCMEMRP